MNNENNLPATAGPKTMQIKNLCPGLQEMGKIKIGNKGMPRQSGSGKTWQAPQKLDHFLITTMARGEDGNFMIDENLHQRFGAAPKAIPVRLLYDDPALNFATRYICYYGKTVFCSGDGETAQRLKRDGSRETVCCPCERQAPTFAGDDGKGKGKCKINGILSAMIEGAEVVGGVWKFRTTSYNSVVGILSSLALIRRITGGRLAGIPLEMTVTPKTVQDPIKGSQQTIYVVGLQYKGTVENLQKTGYQIAMDEAQHGIKIEHIEEDALRLLSYDGPMGDESEDVVAEFYPEEAAAALASSEAVPDIVPPQDSEQPMANDDPVTLATPGTDPSTPVTETTATEQPATEAPKRERGKPSPGRQRRTKAEVEEDRLADQRDAEAAQTEAQEAEESEQTQETDQEAPEVATTSEAQTEITTTTQSPAGGFPDLF